MSHRPYPNRERALHQLGRHPEASLESLSNEALVVRATSHFGWPTAEELAEVGRRMQTLAEQVTAAFRVTPRQLLRDGIAECNTRTAQLQATPPAR
jgi:hypothetical protein